MKRKRPQPGIEDSHIGRLTEELKANGFDRIESGEVAISVRQLAMMNWRKIDNIEDQMVTKKDLQMLIVAVGVILGSIEVLFHLLGT